MIRFPRVSSREWHIAVSPYITIFLSTILNIVITLLSVSKKIFQSTCIDILLIPLNKILKVQIKCLFQRSPDNFALQLLNEKEFNFHNSPIQIFHQ